MQDPKSPHRPLERLERVWASNPIVFVTTCIARRRSILNCDAAHTTCREVWSNTERLYGWIVGRYVLMPDHVHFFCAAKRDERRLETFVGKWKEWTAKYCHQRLGLEPPLWQERFFDHVLRSSESYQQKWDYVCQNPVRAGLVARSEEWRFQGEMHDLRFD